jgi:hypothetical protein
LIVLFITFTAIIKAKLKTFKILSITLLLVAVLSGCNLPGKSSAPIQITNQNPVGSIETVTLQVNPTRTEMVTIIPTYTPSLTKTSTPFTPIPSNTPTWSVYNYTCELAVGGATMTMNLAWTDRSNSEEGYKVYRDKQVIATLAPNSTTYIDVAFIATGKALSYSVEAFTKDWQLSTSTITYACQ